MPKKRRNKKKTSKIYSKNSINNENNNDNIDEIKEKNKELYNDNDADDEIKITNINYEKFIKENELLLNYIKKSNPLLIIHNEKNKNFTEEVNLKNKSLIKIINQAGLDYEFKIYITLQIISENVDFETLSRKSFSYNPKLVNYIKSKEKYNIKLNQKKNINISINKNNLYKIFNFMNIYAYEEIINYIELTVTKIFYEYEKSQNLYSLKTAKNIKKLIYNNKIFCVKINNSNNNITVLLTNYSINKIFNLNDGGKDTKYLLINYKIKENENISNEDINNKDNIYINKLINASDIKNIYLKYYTEKNKVLNNKKISKINSLNITDLNYFLNSSSDLLNNILSQIYSKKSEILNLSEKIKNQFIKLKLEDNSNIFISKKVLKQLEMENILLKNNIASITTLDYKKEKINIELKYFTNLDEDNDIYIQIEYDKKKYLCKKNDVQKIYDCWKILNQIEAMDVIINDNKHISYYSKINIELLKLNIIEYNDIINIQYNQNYIKEKMSLSEYINSLPKKNVYNIKYKVKVKRIPKNINNQ